MFDMISYIYFQSHDGPKIAPELLAQWVRGSQWGAVTANVHSQFLKAKEDHPSRVRRRLLPLEGPARGTSLLGQGGSCLNLAPEETIFWLQELRFGNSYFLV